LRVSECTALAATSGVVVTSETTALLLVSDFGVPAGRITVVRPGSDPVPIAQGSNDGLVRLLAVGSVVPRKGYDVLVAALSRLADLPWRLTIAGDRTRDPATAAALETAIERHRLGDRITLLGAVDSEQLPALYLKADLFALASRFEGYGMALAAAVAHGLPVVATTAGAIPGTVPAAAGLLVAPDDVDAFTDALQRAIADEGIRHRLAIGARDAARHLPRWSESAVLFARAIEMAS
jgi:glycosyltransferase involved in cell wall biosynthesis